MRLGLKLVVLAIVTPLSPGTVASGADLGEGVYAPPAYAPGDSCLLFAGEPAKAYYERRDGRSSQPTMTYTYPFDPNSPPADPVSLYVPPQVAYIASTLCTDRPPRNWYANKLFYYSGGTSYRPDTFMIVRKHPRPRYFGE